MNLSIPLNFSGVLIVSRKDGNEIPHKQKDKVEQLMRDDQIPDFPTLEDKEKIYPTWVKGKFLSLPEGVSHDLTHDNFTIYCTDNDYEIMSRRGSGYGSKDISEPNALVLINDKKEGDEEKIERKGNLINVYI